VEGGKKNLQKKTGPRQNKKGAQSGEEENGREHQTNSKDWLTKGNDAEGNRGKGNDRTEHRSFCILRKKLSKVTTETAGGEGRKCKKEKKKRKKEGTGKIKNLTGGHREERRLGDYLACGGGAFSGPRCTGEKKKNR